ncbi:MAG: hypothetical protein IKD93_01920 [Firmicutes bacterium]|nr:hypothetical protein [Bacillota bacterium]
MLKGLRNRLSATEEAIKPKDTLGFVRFMVTFSDDRTRMMDGRDLFAYALLRDIEIARHGADPGAILEDTETKRPYVEYEVIRGKWSDLPPGIVRAQIKNMKGV